MAQGQAQADNRLEPLVANLQRTLDKQAGEILELRRQVERLLQSQDEELEQVVADLPARLRERVKVTYRPSQNGAGRDQAGAGYAGYAGAAQMPLTSQDIVQNVLDGLPDFLGMAGGNAR